MKIKMKNGMLNKASIIILAALLFIVPLQTNAAEISEESEMVSDIDEIIMVEDEAEPEEIITDDTETENLTTDDEIEKVQVSEIDLGDYSEKMLVGEKQLLGVTVLPIKASDTVTTYSSSNTKVATINGMGRITALALGKTTITVTAGDVSQSFEIQVVEEEDETISVTDIEIADHESELEVEETLTVSGTVLPSDATDTDIKYTSSNTSVATVSSAGEVKGISKGDVTITLSAGGVSKNVLLTVKVATTGIRLNEDYLVLKLNDTYQLSAEVTPKEADQNVTFQSADTEVATVSEAGLVTAVGTGSTSIIVSNEDSSVAVSVIVNTAINYNPQNDAETVVPEEKVYANSILVAEQSIVDSEMLQYFYENKQILKIVGDGYVIEIDGNDIINFNNEFHTDISLIRENDAIRFTLNHGNELCGAVTLRLEEADGKYLYLYNTSKEKYQQIDVSNMNELKLTTAGEYQISKTKIKADMHIVLYVVAAGTAIVIICIVIYILVKRRYWFW